jgi:hypothetical protein
MHRLFVEDPDFGRSLIEQLTANEIGLLDTSFCFSVYRDSFLNILSSKHTQINGRSPPILTISYSKWLSDRNISIIGKKEKIILNNTFLRNFTGSSHNIMLTRDSSLICDGIWATNLQSLLLFFGSKKQLEFLGSIEISNTSAFNCSSMLRIISQNCFHITSCNFDGTSFDEESLVLFSKACKKLTHIRLNSCEKLTQKAVDAFAENCPHIFELQVMCNRLNQTFAGCIPFLSTTIQALNLSHNDSILFDSASFHKLAKTCINLTILFVSNMTFVDDSVLKQFGVYLTKLTTIDISSCVRVTDSGFADLCTSCTLLKEIKFDFLNLLTIDSFTIITNYLFDLQTVSFNGLRVIKWQMFFTLTHIFKTITHYDLIYCSIAGVRFPRSALFDELAENVPFQFNVLNYLCVNRHTILTLEFDFRHCAKALKELWIEDIDDVLNEVILLEIAYRNKFDLSCLTIVCIPNGFVMSCNDLNRAITLNENLTQIHIFDCCDLDDSTLNTIAEYCKMLESLTVSGSKITDFGLINLATKCKFLSELDLTDCLSITANGVKEVLKVALLLNRLKVNYIEIDGENFHSVLV